MSQSFAPPAGPPPRSQPSSAPTRQDSIDQDIMEEPPPAYTSVVNGQSSDLRVDAGPNRMDFSGPPPLPDRLRPAGTGTGVAHHVTGVGEGYGRRPEAGAGGAWGSGNPFGDQYQSPQPTGAAQSSSPSRPSKADTFDPPVGAPPSKSGFGSSPQHPSTSGAGPSNRPPPPSHQSSHAGPSQVDTSPTEVPTPGRPLLHNGMMLVYPKGHFCHKCYNTGYKANDPNNPHEADWKKYGKHYNSALAHSYTSTTGSSTADNFQRPLPALPQPAGPSSFGQPAPNKWHAFPGHAPPPPSAPQHQGPYGPGPGPMMSSPPMAMGYGGMMPPGPIVYQAGDPRIGGRLCWRCGGDGRETSFFGFDDGKCWECGGIGRVFR